ncbi:MAG TPA: class I SAM-dependent methyltransferase [Streptosporangiaceae bacterium]|nr:class I SAM-dependent methyltransferase [Streptosporangiaceae bacterium]
MMAGIANGDQQVSHEHAPDITIQFTQEFWDDRYRSAGQLWSGQPNPQLVAQTAGLTPGDALDIGCGEGADAIWLASQGWTVTAVDISAVALDRATAHAADRGEEIARRISWRQADLLSWDPGPQQFDLVSAQFMYLPEVELKSLHRRLAAAVRPGGILLIVLHHPDSMHAGHGSPSGHGSHAGTGSPAGTGPAGQNSPTAAGPGLADTATGRALLALALQPQRLAETLDPAAFDIMVADVITRQATDRDGQPTTATDTVLRAARKTSG